MPNEIESALNLYAFQNKDENKNIIRKNVVYELIGIRHPVKEPWGLQNSKCFIK